MRRPSTLLSLLVALALLALSGCCTTGPAIADTVPLELEMKGVVVSAIDLDLVDDKRAREVPVRVYLPEVRKNRLPVVFVSHGIGESRTSYEWLGRSLASHGYVVIHPTHRGTDRATLEEGWIAMYKATKNRDNWINRPLDISFILDQLPAIESSYPGLQDVFDLERVGVVGHSAGAWTAAAIGGVDLESGDNFRDPRVDAIAPLSMPKTKSVEPEDEWATLTLPALHMTGTCDRQIIWMTFPSHRRIPWAKGNADDQYLLTLEGGRHTTFSNKFDPAKRAQASLQLVTARAVTSFLDAYVAGDAARREELRAGGFEKMAPGLMQVEQRPPIE